MTSVTVGGLLAQTEVALAGLHQRYEAVRTASADTPRSMLADLLREREASTITAIDRYRALDEHHAALDVYVRLGSGFPFTDVPSLPEDPQIEQMIAVAEETDNALEQLGERVELYAAGAEVHAAFDALDALVRWRRHQLASAMRELENGE